MQTALLGAAIIGAAVLFALGGLRIFHPLTRDAPTHDVAGFLIAVVGAVYAVVLGFVTVSVWESFGHASTLASREATEAVGIYNAAGALPEPGSGRVRAALLDYVRAAEGEWPALARGGRSPEAHAALARLGEARAAIEPSTPREQALYEMLLHSGHEMIQARDLRLLAARERLHPVVWFVLIAGGAITIAFTWFFRLGRLPVQAAMTAGVAILIALNLFLIAATDNPFAGDVRVEPTAFREALAVMEERDR